MSIWTVVGMLVGLLGTGISALGHQQELDNAVERKLKELNKEENDEEEEES